MKSIDKERCSNCGTGLYGENSVCNNCWEHYLRAFCKLIPVKNYSYVYAIRTLKTE